MPGVISWDELEYWFDKTKYDTVNQARINAIYDILLVFKSSPEPINEHSTIIEFLVHLLKKLHEEIPYKKENNEQ